MPTPDIMSTPDPTPKSLTADRLEALPPNAENRPFLKVDFQTFI